MLVDFEMKIIQESLLKLESGKFTLMSIFGDKWSSVKNPNVTGKAFKKMVLNGNFPGVNFESKKTNNHSTYVLEKK